MNPVLPSLKPILEDSKFVTTDEDAIRKIAPELAKEELSLPNWRAPVFIEEDSNRTIEFFFLGNTINFAFMDFSSKQKFEIEYKGNWTGAFGMFACLKRALDNEIPIWCPDYLENITFEQTEKLFSGKIAMPMIMERKEIFNEVGKVLNDKYRSFSNLVKASDYKAFGGNGIVDRLVKDFSSFNDVSEFNGNELMFYKRSQLAVAMPFARLRNTELFKIKDVDELTVFADYQLPKGLKRMGVLKYAESLDERIRKQEIIEKDSREELEIRAHTIYASDLLVKEINKRGEKKICALEMDYKLWSESRKSTEPHHLTKTIFY